jgi:hypothetical protein
MKKPKYLREAEEAHDAAALKWKDEVSKLRKKNKDTSIAVPISDDLKAAATLADAATSAAAAGVTDEQMVTLGKFAKPDPFVKKDRPAKKAQTDADK